MEKTFDTLKKEARENHIPVMKEDGMDFLLEYIQIHENIRDILEVGTAIGLSAMKMASIRWDMNVDTLEVNEEMYKQAIQNIAENGLSDRIHVYLCDGADFESNKKYDLIFIDAAKSQYRKYLEHFLKNAQKNTVFVFDNLNFHGLVDDPSISNNRGTIQMVHKIKQFREHLLKDDRFQTEFYSEIGDGIAISVLKDERF